MSAHQRVVGFALVPLFGAVIPLVALPAITAEFGGDAWAAIAVSIAVGAIAGTTVELGWAWNGPMRIARSGDRSRHRTIAIAMTSRGLTFLPAAAVCALVAPALSPAFALESGAVAVATAAFGLSNSWVFIGLGQPWRLLLLDTIPRVVFVVLSTVFIHLGTGLWVYAYVGLLLPALLIPIATTILLGARATDFRGLGFRRALLVVRAQAHVTVARLISNAYIQLPTVLVAAFASVGQLATFAAGDRLAKMGLSGLAPMPSMFQRWVGKSPVRSERVRRASRAVVINAAVGVIAGAAFALVAPAASRWLFSGTATIDIQASLILGGTIAVVSTSRAIGGIALVATEQQRGLLRSAIVGSAVGIPALCLLTITYGSDGAFLGVLISETAVLTSQLATLVQYRRRDRTASLDGT